MPSRYHFGTHAPITALICGIDLDSTYQSLCPLSSADAGPALTGCIVHTVEEMKAPPYRWVSNSSMGTVIEQDVEGIRLIDECLIKTVIRMSLGSPKRQFEFGSPT